MDLVQIGPLSQLLLFIFLGVETQKFASEQSQGENHDPFYILPFPESQFPC